MSCGVQWQRCFICFKDFCRLQPRYICRDQDILLCFVIANTYLHSYVMFTFIHLLFITTTIQLNLNNAIVYVVNL